MAINYSFVTFVQIKFYSFERWNKANKTYFDYNYNNRNNILYNLMCP